MVIIELKRLKEVQIADVNKSPHSVVAIHYIFVLVLHQLIKGSVDLNHRIYLDRIDLLH